MTGPTFLSSLFAVVFVLISAKKAPKCDCIQVKVGHVYFFLSVFIFIK